MGSRKLRGQVASPEYIIIKHYWTSCTVSLICSGFLSVPRDWVSSLVIRVTVTPTCTTPATYTIFSNTASNDAILTLKQNTCKRSKYNHHLDMSTWHGWQKAEEWDTNTGYWLGRLEYMCEYICIYIMNIGKTERNIHETRKISTCVHCLRNPWWRCQKKKSKAKYKSNIIQRNSSSVNWTVSKKLVQQQMLK